MSNIFRGTYPTLTSGYTLFTGGRTDGFPGQAIGPDHGPQLQVTEGIPTTALDQNKWMLPITSVSGETPVWKPVVPDIIFAPVAVALLGATFVGPLLPTPTVTSWYPDQVLAPDRLPQYQAYAGPEKVEPPFPGWLPVFPDAFPTIQPIQPVPGFVPTVAPNPTPPVFPDILHFDVATPEYYQFIAWPGFAPVYTGNQTVAIHVPDEFPPNVQQQIKVEYLVFGAAVPFDPPGPQIQIYHLDAAGNQVIDVAFVLMTQFGANPSYFFNWTPTVKGVYMIDVIGFYLAQQVMLAIATTVRDKFDPIAIALEDAFVSRNGDV